MRCKWVVCGGAALAAVLGWRALADEKPKAPPAADAALVKRGDNLVNEVARCGDCHTPRDRRGDLDNTRRLQGAPIWFRPRVKPRGEWEDRAPDITASGKAGKWGEEKMARYLMGGKGEKPEAPMPAYHLSAADARAVAAYLRSLPGRKGKAPRKKDDD